MEWLAALVVLVCFGVGTYYQNYSDKIDSTAEEIAEEVLETQDIKKDFSANKKKKLAEAAEKKD